MIRTRWFESCCLRKRGTRKLLVRTVKTRAVLKGGTKRGETHGKTSSFSRVVRATSRTNFSTLPTLRRTCLSALPTRDSTCADRRKRSFLDAARAAAVMVVVVGLEDVAAIIEARLVGGGGLKVVGASSEGASTSERWIRFLPPSKATTRTPWKAKSVRESWSGRDMKAGEG